MADDDKQVEIEVALRDTASATLRGISREIDNITRKLVETGRKGNEALDSLRRKGGEAGQGSNKAAEGVDKFTKSITGLAKSLVGPLGLAGAFYAVGKSLSSFVHSKAELSLLTADLGLTATKMGEVKQILMRKGFSEEAAKKFITTIAGQLQDLKVHDVYSEFYRRLEIYGDAKLTESVIKSVKSDKVSEAFDTVISHTQKLLESKDPQNRLRGQYAARELLGQTPAYFTQWRDYNKDLVAGAKSDTDELKKALQEEIDLRTKIGNIKTETLMWVLKTLTGISGAAKESEAPKPPPGAPGSPNIGTDDKGLKVYGPRSTSPTAPPIEVPMPGTIGPRSDLDLGTSGSTEWSSSNRPRRGTVAKTLDEIEPIEKETNQTLISIRDILQAMYGDPTKPPGAGGSPTGGSPTGGSPTGGSPTGGGGGVTGGAIGALSGTVHGHQVDAYGGLTGKKLFDPMTATHLGGGLGGHSQMFGPGHHEGLDIMGPVGSKVHAIQDGTIVRAPQKGHGNDQVMIVRHDDGTYTRYLHQSWSRNTVASGRVSGGQQVGVSGHRNADHSHVEVWVGFPGARGSKLVNLRAVMGYNAKNLPVGGTPRIGRGPSDTPAPVVTPSVGSRPATSYGPGARPGVTIAGGKVLAATPAADPKGWRTGLASWFDDASTSTGMHRSVPGIALPDPTTKGQWFWVRDNSTGKEILTQQTDVGPMGWTKKSIDINRPLKEKFGYPGNKFPTGNKRGFSWRPAGEGDRDAIDRANKGGGRQSSRPDGRVRASVDFGAMQKVREAGEIFMPVRTASFGQGSTVHRNASLPGGDYTRWTA